MGVSRAKQFRITVPLGSISRGESPYIFRSKKRRISVLFHPANATYARQPRNTSSSSRANGVRGKKKKTALSLPAPRSKYNRREIWLPDAARISRYVEIYNNIQNLPTNSRVRARQVCPSLSLSSPRFLIPRRRGFLSCVRTNTREPVTSRVVARVRPPSRKALVRVARQGSASAAAPSRVRVRSATAVPGFPGSRERSRSLSPPLRRSRRARW